ncbi:MAG TPA: dTMP kinase [Smithellaceae bacterium]|nr:dTMP kinase [Smithellaceae bacterium]
MNQLITFEGIEGCGKTTQLKIASAHLSSSHVPHIVTQEPTGTAIGKKIGAILFNRDSFHLSAVAELLLFGAARAQHVQEIILPALQQNKVVLCDRFSDATYAYQGAARGLDFNFIKTINDYAAQQLKPGLTLLFDLPVEISLRRALERNNLLQNSADSDRFEREALDFHNRVRSGYLQLAQSEPERFVVIDAARSIEAIREDTISRIMKFIGCQK